MTDLRISRKGFTLGALAGAGALLTPAAARAAFGDAFTATSTLAVIVPLSGSYIRAGEQIADGVREAIDQANRFTTGLERGFVMRPFDDQDLVATAIQNAQFASDDPSIVGAIGHLSGQVTLTTLQTYAAANLPLIVPASTFDRITAQGYRNVFRLPTKDSTEGRFAARFVLGSRKPKSIVVAVQDGDYGGDVARAFAQEAAGSKIPIHVAEFSVENPNYSAAARDVLSASPDLVYLAGTTRDMGPLIDALRSAGYHGDFFATEGFYNNETLQKYGKAAPDLIVSSSMPPLERAPSVLRDFNDLRQRYGEVTPFRAFGYAAAQIFISAIRRGAFDRLSILRTLATFGQFQTVVGTFSFAPTGDPLDPNLYFYSIRDGRFHYDRAAHMSAFIL